MKIYLVIILVILVIVPLTAKKIGGVKLPDEFKFDDNILQMNGAGLRKKLIIKVYACALYLPEKSTSSEQILNDTTAIAIRMHFIYKKVDQEKLIDAWNEGFKKTNAHKQFAIETSQFNALFSEPALKGDVYDIVYLPSKGVQVTKNGDVLGTISNPLFRKAVFSIWLMPETDLPKLRKNLLDG